MHPTFLVFLIGDASFASYFLIFLISSALFKKLHLNSRIVPFFYAQPRRLQQALKKSNHQISTNAPTITAKAST
jgi:hypothetical protein